MLKGLVTAIRTLSVLPVPGRDAEDMSAALPWFAVVGCLLGFILYAVSLLAALVTGYDWPEGVATAVLIGGIVLTRGLHLDGLADWADGFWGARDKQRTLEIMKDSRIGAFGVLALVAVLMAKWVALTRLASLGLSVWIVAAYVVSRTMLTELSACLPYARPEGGTGASFVRNARPVHRLLALSSGLALLLVIYGPAGGVVFGVGWIGSSFFGLWCYRRLGGVTGDLLGACSEIVETLILVVSALAGGALARSTCWTVLFG